MGGSEQRHATHGGQSPNRQWCVSGNLAKAAIQAPLDHVHVCLRLSWEGSVTRIIAIALLLAGIQPAGAFSLMTWNVAEGSVETVTRREPDILRLGATLRGRLQGSLPDVLVLQEVTSYAAAMRVARAFGYQAGTVAASDSGSDREIWPFALEVAIVTARPVVSVTSYQSRADNKPFVAALATGDVSYGTVTPVAVPAAVALPPNEPIPRAILRVEIEGNTVIYGVHLNSSGLGFCRLDDAMKGAAELRRKAEALGLSAEAQNIQAAMDRVRQEIGRARDPGIHATKQEALRRVRTREAAAGAVAALAAVDQRAGKTVFVAGDFNTPLNEPCKTGKRLEEDFEPMLGCATRLDPASCGTRDGFDDTYAVLTSGVVEGVRFKVLTEGLGRTYVKGNFVDSPIDNVLVAGPGADAPFTAAKIMEEGSNPAFGSDHTPVLVVRTP